MLRFRQYLIFNYVKKLCTQFLLEVNLKALSRVKNTNGLINFNVRLEAEKETLETRSTIPAPPVFPTESKRISL